MAHLSSIAHSVVFANFLFACVDQAILKENILLLLIFAEGDKNKNIAGNIYDCEMNKKRNQGT